MVKQFFFNEELKKLNDEMNRRLTYSFFKYLMNFMFKEESKINLKVFLNVDKKSNILSGIVFSPIYINKNNNLYIFLNFYGFVFDKSLFIHLYDTVDYNNDLYITNKEIQNFLFFVYGNNQISKILIRNQYFNQSKLLNHKKDLFLNFLNHYKFKEEINIDLKIFNNAEKREDEISKLNIINYSNNIYNFIELKKCKGFIKHMNFVFKRRLLIENYKDDKFKDSEFFTFQFNSLDNYTTIVNYSILQDVFNFDNFSNYVMENIKKNNFKRYTEIKEFKDNLKGLQQQEIMQKFNFNDLKFLVED